jgi:hypothetical protein
MFPIFGMAVTPYIIAVTVRTQTKKKRRILSDALIHRTRYVTSTFKGPCIVRIFQYISHKMQRYTVYFIWKLLYMFRVVPPPIIKSANNCIYSF